MTAVYAPTDEPVTVTGITGRFYTIQFADGRERRVGATLIKF